MTAVNHDALRDVCGLYALDALTGVERAEFEAHLQTCDECRAEVRALAPVADGLLGAVPVLEPPANLRARVLGNVTGSMPVARAPEPPRTRVASWSFFAGLAAAAALVAAAGLGVYAGQLRTRVTDLEARLQEATLRASAAERQIADARQTAAEAQSTVAVLAAPDLARVDLAGQPPASQASGRAFVSRSRGVVFTASNLPALPAGKVYQLWVVTPQAALSVGLLRPDDAGRVAAILAAPQNLTTMAAVAVTLESEGGVPAPTGEKYLVGTPAAGL